MSNMKNLIAFTAVFLSVSCKDTSSPMVDASASSTGGAPGTYATTSDGGYGGEGATDSGLGVQQSTADDVLTLINKTNDLLENCVMPAQGLYPKRAVCDDPPLVCEVQVIVCVAE